MAGDVSPVAMFILKKFFLVHTSPHFCWKMSPLHVGAETVLIFNFAHSDIHYQIFELPPPADVIVVLTLCVIINF